MASHDVTSNAYFTILPSDLPACSSKMQGAKLREAREAIGELLEDYCSSIRQHATAAHSQYSVINAMLSKDGQSILQHDPDRAETMYATLRDSLLGLCDSCCFPWLSCSAFLLVSSGSCKTPDSA